jgi:hypothetical protein
MPGRRRSYGATYRTARRAILVGDPPCAFGCGRPATTADHRPALAAHRHLEGSGCCELVPACMPCNAHAGSVLGNEIRWAGAQLRRGGGWSAG